MICKQHYIMKIVTFQAMVLLSTESRVYDPPSEKLLRWQHHFIVTKTIPGGSTLAVCIHFASKLYDLTFSRHGNPLSVDLVVHCPMTDFIFLKQKKMGLS